jgi:hypothetical protein
MKPLVRDPDSEVLMVHELIDEELNCWNKEKLENIFVYPDMVAISSIPLGRGMEDFWLGIMRRVVFRSDHVTEFWHSPRGEMTRLLVLGLTPISAGSYFGSWMCHQRSNHFGG